jgi:hypothetical protein
MLSEKILTWNLYKLFYNGAIVCRAYIYSNDFMKGFTHGPAALRTQEWTCATPKGNSELDKFENIMTPYDIKVGAGVSMFFSLSLQNGLTVNRFRFRPKGARWM